MEASYRNLHIMLTKATTTKCLAVLNFSYMYGSEEQESSRFWPGY